MISTPAQRDSIPEQANIYNTTFWLAYVANVLIVTAHSLTFRFADYVKNLGGNEDLSGRVMSVAVIAAVFFRFFLGQKIDQSGTRRIWLYSTLVFIASCAMFLFLNRLGIGLYLSRILFNASLAGMLSCSIVNIQNLAPANRRTEIIGSLGSSG
ncbi:MAG: MFS transporter, partial [Planctomycetaceae bacterium]|nr:MFS transporter [Planctomycetaceae bacterium]